MILSELFPLGLFGSHGLADHLFQVANSELCPKMSPAVPWKVWNAALALPGAPGREGRAQRLGRKIKCCSFIWQHRLLPAGAWPGTGGMQRVRKDRERQRKGTGREMF